MRKKKREKYAVYGCKGDLKMRVLREMPCAARARWNWMYAIETDIQVNKEAMVVRFWNQVKTVLEPVEQDMYVRRETAAVIRMQ